MSMSAITAISILWFMGGCGVSTAATNAISTKGLVSMMLKYRIEIVYQMTMSAAKVMLSKGLVTETDYRLFEQEMLEKYKPETGDLFSNLDLQ